MVDTCPKDELLRNLETRLVKFEEKVSAADNEMVAGTPLFSNEVGTAQGRTAYQNKRRDGHSLPSCNDTCVWKDDVMKRINEYRGSQASGGTRV